ncbi:S41 family peptidase [Sorangium sp. KYC3313]|uniref:S41 family peptidase n=1 Tax=Sorangium sp. KYC3313 TaxID=3449740 RepID=UPI003F8C145C
MLPVANRGAGQFIAAPDVCRTPPVGVPIPYVNVAFNAMATVFAANVLTSMMPSLTVGSVIPMSIGDEPGVMHPTIKGAAVVTASFTNVFFNFLPAAHLASLTAGNNFNAPLGLIAVPSATNVFTMRTGIGESLQGALEVAVALAPGAAGDGLSGEILAPGVGCVALPRIAIDGPALLHREIGRLRARGMEVLVLDLRGNPGGDVKAAVEIAGGFLPEGTLLATVIDEEGDAAEHRARPGAPYTMPLVVWVDRFTASAAELLAACLQAHGRAVVAGEATYGKGTAAMWDAGCAGRGARVRLPDGREISTGGVLPDTG